MPDYGHDLRFGTFITPVAAAPQKAVELAQLSEELGFDLVSFQDHPYLSRFLDTWTLLTWVAGATSRIHVAPNVLNLPLRPPAVTARQALSLDLLSGGRLDLGLGAGGFWDAIAAMGGRRLTPGQSVDALREGLDLIEGIWDAGERGVLHAGGEYYRVDGAQRGPASTRRIPIWLGAYKPRMLRLTGRRADGWLPSLPYLEEGDLARGNEAIDAAAMAAGRDPREIRRLLNLPGPTEDRFDTWTADLVKLALEDGIGTFILMGDDARLLRYVATEVAPAVRGEVTAARRDRGTPPAPTRDARGRAARVAGIAYDEVPAVLAEAAVEPGDPGYAQARATYLRGGAPGLVLRPRTVQEVQAGVTFANRHRSVPFGLRSGGHGISGRSTNQGGIVLDVGALQQATVLDVDRRLVRLGPGMRWARVAGVLDRQGWALTSGDYGGVAVGGLATAGGAGWFAREHGLTIDHLRAVEMVLADGSLVRASAEENPDLFWAVRGAGANFGVGVAFDFEADRLGHDVGYARLVLGASDIAGLLEGFGEVVEGSARDLTAALIVLAARGSQPPLAIVGAVVDSDRPEVIVKRLEPLVLGPLYDQTVSLTSYESVMNDLLSDAPQAGSGEPHGRSGLVDHLTPEIARYAERAVTSQASYWFHVRSVGGAVADIPSDATAYANRSANFSISALGADEARLEQAWSPMRPLLQGMYLSFETSLDPGRLTEAFPPATLTRLRELKARYDPTNLFRDNFNLVAAGDALERTA